MPLNNVWFVISFDNRILIIKLLELSLILYWKKRNACLKIRFWNFDLVFWRTLFQSLFFENNTSFGEYQNKQARRHYFLSGFIMENSEENCKIQCL